jgi:hypothetical protein
MKAGASILEQVLSALVACGTLASHGLFYLSFYFVFFVRGSVSDSVCVQGPFLISFRFRSLRIEKNYTHHGVRRQGREELTQE